MNNFEYYSPTKVVFGRGAEEQVGQLVLAENAKKVLIHYGSGSVIRSGLLDRVKQSLKAQGIDFVELGGVVPNPRLLLARQGIALVKNEGVDFILAVGGGSVIDSAKCIGYGAANEGDVWDFYKHTRTPKACLPVGSVLTIAAAGSETSMGSVMTNEDGWDKKACDNDLSRPRFTVMNPELTMTLPPYQTASGCTDIMMHTMERYFNKGENMEITDAISEALLRTVMHNAKVLVQQPQNYNARAEMMWAGSLAHNGLTGCGTDGGDFATHNLEHEVGGLFDVTHGAGLAALWGSWARHVYKQRPQRFAQYAVNVMGLTYAGTEEELALKGIEAMEEFYRSIDMPISLSQMGVHPTNEQIEEMASKCIAAFPEGIGVVKRLQKDDMIEIFKAAL